MFQAISFHGLCLFICSFFTSSACFSVVTDSYIQNDWFSVVPSLQDVQKLIDVVSKGRARCQEVPDQVFKLWGEVVLFWDEKSCIDDL